MSLHVGALTLYMCCYLIRIVFVVILFTKCVIDSALDDDRIVTDIADPLRIKLRTWISIKLAFAPRITQNIGDTTSIKKGIVCEHW